jgi:hypothetical protein
LQWAFVSKVKEFFTKVSYVATNGSALEINFPSVIDTLSSHLKHDTMLRVCGLEIGPG